MAETITKSCVTGLISMAHAADARRSVDFCTLLGMKFAAAHAIPLENCGSTWPATRPNSCSRARLNRLSSANRPCCFISSPNLVAVREHLLASAVRVSGITYPDYMPKGEIRVADPDGYALLIAQAG
jgi:hypothetical protein